jgi:hypothetical protein
MNKLELTQEQKEFRLDDYTLNRQFIYWLTKSKCMWDLKTANLEYNKLRENLDHAIAFEKIKVMMFNLGIK